MAKRGLSKINDQGIRKTPDWSGDEKEYARVAVEQYEEHWAQENAKESRLRLIGRLVRRLSKPTCH